MDRPLLHSLVDRLRADETPARLRRGAARARARVRAGAAAARRGALRGARRGRSACCCPTTPTRATWPSRRRGSSARRASRSSRRAACAGAPGLEPPPHLVGERARALDVLARGGLVCVVGARARRADAAARGAARAARDRARRRAGDRPARRGARARRLRARRARRGARPVRGSRRARRRLPDDRPRAAAHRVLRRRDRGHPRLLAVHAARAARDRRRRRSTPPASGAASSSRSTLADDEDPFARRAPADDLVLAARPPARLRLAAGRGARGLGRGGPRRARARGRDRARPVPAGPAVLVRRAAAGAHRARALRGGERAQRPAQPGPRRRRRVRAPRRGRAPAPPAAARRAGRCSRPGVEPEGLVFAVAPARRGFVWRDLGVALLPDTQVFRRKAPRATAPIGPRARELLRPAHRRLRRARGPRHRAADRLRDEGGRRRRRATTCCSAFRGEDRVFVPHEQIGKVSRYIGSDSKAPTLSKLGGKAWDNLKTRAREHLREMAGELLQLYAERQTRPGVAYDVEQEWVERLEAEFPYRETEDQARAIEAVKEDLEAPHPMDRLVCGDVGFGKTEVALRAAFTVAVAGKQVLMLVPTTMLAQQHWNTFRDRYRDFPVRVEMVSRFRKPADVKQRAGRVRRGQGRRADRDAPRALARRDPEGPRARDRRRGAALRRRAEGAAAPAAPRGRRARAVARRRSRARCTCRSPGCATSR